MKKILIVDDHVLLRQGLMKLIDSHFPSTHYGEAGNLAEGLAMVENERWDVVLLDINLPGRSGLEIIHEIKNRRIHLPIIVISMYPESQFAVRVLRAGASGYLTKDTAPDNLYKALNQVFSGSKYITPSVAELLTRELENDTGKPLHESLSNREYHVLRLLGEGKTISEIARQLSLSVKTISTYRTRILKKLRLNDNSEIISYTIEHRLRE